jgi:putative transposase
MARKARLLLPGSPMYVQAKGLPTLKIFASDDMKLNFLAWLRDAAKTYQLTIHAYSILPNQLEMLVTPKDELSLSRTMQSLCRRFTQKFNQQHHKNGTVWQGRYYSKMIESDQDLLMCQAMIDLSSVKEKLVSHPEHYIWSSYRIHTGQESNYGLVDVLPFWRLGNTPFERQQNWRNWLMELSLHPH